VEVRFVFETHSVSDFHATDYHFMGLGIVTAAVVLGGFLWLYVRVISRTFLCFVHSCFGCTVESFSRESVRL